MAITLKIERHPVLELLDKAIRASYVEGCIKDEMAKWDRHEAVEALEKALEPLLSKWEPITAKDAQWLKESDARRET